MWWCAEISVCLYIITLTSSRHHVFCQINVVVVVVDQAEEDACHSKRYATVELGDLLTLDTCAVPAGGLRHIPWHTAGSHSPSPHPFSPWSARHGGSIHKLSAAQTAVDPAATCIDYPPTSVRVQPSCRFDTVVGLGLRKIWDRLFSYISWLMHVQCMWNNLASLSTGDHKCISRPAVAIGPRSLPLWTLAVWPLALREWREVQIMCA